MDNTQTSGTFSRVKQSLQGWFTKRLLLFAAIFWALRITGSNSLIDPSYPIATLVGSIVGVLLLVSLLKLLYMAAARLFRKAKTVA